jgi:hypothetical protein
VREGSLSAEGRKNRTFLKAGGCGTLAEFAMFFGSGAYFWKQKAKKRPLEFCTW